MLVRLIRSLANGIGMAFRQTSTLTKDELQLRRAQERYEAGDLPASIALYEDVLRRDDDHTAAQYGLGVVFGRMGRYKAAEIMLNRVVAKRANSVDALNALGNVMRMQGQPLEAESLYRRALVVNADAAPVWANLALCLNDTDRSAGAIDALRRALDLTPEDAGVLVNLAMVWNDIGDAQQAQSLLQRALELDANLAEAHLELAQIFLRRGEYAKGWSHYEWRRRVEKWELLPNYSCPPWRGEDLAGKNLLVTAEQGLGDQIMFAGCLPDVLRTTSHCLIESHSQLVELFKYSFPEATICSTRVVNPVIEGNVAVVPDYKIAIGSLPSRLRRHQADFPRHRGYLRADSARIERWRTRLVQLGPGRKIGISWLGGTTRTHRSKRSIDLAQWLPLLRRKDCQFVSLQYGEVEADLAAMSSDYSIHISHWKEAIDDYEETAALVCALDLVVSVQTAVVHLTGALGQGAWVMVPAVPEWRYGQTAETMPWYPSVKLFRQSHSGDWQPVIGRVSSELDHWLRGEESC